MITSILPGEGRKERRGETERASGTARATSARLSERQRRLHTAAQALRSLGRLGCTCYQASTCRLSTRSSSWDLIPHASARERVGILGSASRLDAFSASPCWT